MNLSILLVLSNGFHMLATVLLIGFYTLLYLVWLPAVKKQLAPTQENVLIGELFTRFRLWQYLSFLIFAVSGIVLTLVDRYYLGFGQFVNNWSIVMLVKHVLIVFLIGLCIYTGILSANIRAKLQAETTAAPLKKKLKTTAGVLTSLGVLILFLTALAQAY